MESILKLQGINLEIDASQILKNITCNIPHKKITVVIGPSGAGKSSLLKSITRLLPATGPIEYGGQKMSRDTDLSKFRKEVIYVSQVPVVFDGTVAENINWGREIWQLDLVDPVEYLKMVGLDEISPDRNANDLSVGQQQRLHLARSLALQPKVLLLDEPASGLDAISKEVFENLIKELRDIQEDLSIVMITHDLEQAKRLAEYAILLDKGEMKLEADGEEFFKEVQNMSEAEMLEKLLEGSQ